MSLLAKIVDGEIEIVEARWASGNAPLHLCKVHIDNKGDGTCEVTWSKPRTKKNGEIMRDRFGDPVMHAPETARVRFQAYIVIPDTDTAEALAEAQPPAPVPVPAPFWNEPPGEPMNDAQDSTFHDEKE